MIKVGDRVWPTRRVCDFEYQAFTFGKSYEVKIVGTNGRSVGVEDDDEMEDWLHDGDYIVRIDS